MLIEKNIKKGHSVQTNSFCILACITVNPNVTQEYIDKSTKEYLESSNKKGFDLLKVNDAYYDRTLYYYVTKDYIIPDALLNLDEVEENGMSDGEAEETYYQELIRGYTIDFKEAFYKRITAACGDSSENKGVFNNTTMTILVEIRNQKYYFTLTTGGGIERTWLRLESDMKDQSADISVEETFMLDEQFLIYRQLLVNQWIKFPEGFSF